MAEGDDDSQKTEEPSEKRLRDAIEKGQVIFSRELNNFIIFATLTLIVVSIFPYLAKRFLQAMRPFIENSYQFPADEGGLHHLLKNLTFEFLAIVLLPLVLVILVAILSSFIQIGTFIFSFDPISPKFEKLSLLKGFKRLFSMKSLLEFIKGIVKITMVGMAIYVTVYPNFPLLNNLYNYDVQGIVYVLFKFVKEIFIVSSIILAFVGAFDYFYQRYEYYKSLRMSKHDLKEEYKQSEGSPEIKAKLKRIRNERAKKRMMQGVPNADVVITNPTHYSVALKYDSKAMSAPILIAKGQDIIALRIREIAEENDIPIVENAPLARALYTNVEIDQEIPFEYYKAVAEVISYVYNLKGRAF